MIRCGLRSGVSSSELTGASGVARAIHVKGHRMLRAQGNHEILFDPGWLGCPHCVASQAAPAGCLQHVGSLLAAHMNLQRACMHAWFGSCAPKLAHRSTDYELGQTSLILQFNMV